MNNFVFVISVFLIILNLSNISFAAFTYGNCAKSPSFAGFDTKKYSGRWFEIARFSTWFQPSSMKNSTATYTYLNDSMVNVENIGFVNGKPIRVNGYAYVRNSTIASNQLYVVFPTTLFGYPIYQQNGEYNVWSVDYERFSMVYSCRQVIPIILKSESVWILSRTRTLDTLALNILKGLLTLNGVDPSNLIYAN